MALLLNQRQGAIMGQSLSQEERAYSKALGARIAQRRKEVGLTQVQLCEVLGMTQRTYVSYEIGRRRIPVSLLPALAQALMTDTDTLLGMPAKAHAKRGPAPKYQQQVEQISRLPKVQQRLVVKMLEGVLSQGR